MPELSVAIQSDGKIVVAGYSNTNYDFAVARYNTDGSREVDKKANAPTHGAWTRKADFGSI